MYIILLASPPCCFGICVRTHILVVNGVIAVGVPCSTAKSPGLKQGKSWSMLGMFSVRCDGFCCCVSVVVGFVSSFCVIILVCLPCWCLCFLAI